MFVNIPSLSLFQWHPFSLSSAPNQDTVMVHVRVLGNWTRALYVRAFGLACRATGCAPPHGCPGCGRYDMASKHGAPMQVKAFLDGAYGEPGVDVEGDTYDLFLLISGGIGITPMQVLWPTKVQPAAVALAPVRTLTVRCAWF